MTEAKQAHDWSIASNVMALMATLAPFKKKGRKFSPADFNPMLQRKRVVVKAPISVLKDVFIKKTKPEISK